MLGRRTMAAAAAAAVVGLAAGVLAPAWADAAAPGDLDPSFSQDGVALLGAGEAADVLVEPRGRVVLAGSVVTPAGQDLAAARLTASGERDPAFGEDGVATVPLGRSDDRAVAALRVWRGRVLVAAVVEEATGPRTSAEAALVRLLPDGRPDPEFADGGVLRFAAPFGVEVESFLALGLRRDGRLTVALQTSLGLVLGRFGYAGTPDTSLGRTGFRRLEPPSSTRVTAATFDREDRLVVAGVRDDPFLEDYPSIAVSRFTGDGERDTSFGDRGVTATEPPGSTDATQVTSLTVAPDLDVVLGAGLLYWSWDTAVLRAAADGRLEPTFGAGGVVRENLARPPYSPNHSLNHDQPFDLAVLRDGRVVVTGWVAGLDERPELLVARLGRDGTPDLGFGDDGVVRGPVREAGRAVAVQDDGRIVVGVGATPSRTVELAPSWGAVRLLGDVGDLAVAFERPPGPAVPGAGLPLALRVTNSGPSAVSRVEVEAVLRTGGATSRAGGTVGTLGPGESTVVDRWLGVPPASGTVAVQATVRGAAYDPDRGDDVVRARVAVADPPPLGGPAR